MDLVSISRSPLYLNYNRKLDNYVNFTAFCVSISPKLNAMKDNVFFSFLVIHSGFISKSEVGWVGGCLPTRPSRYYLF